MMTGIFPKIFAAKSIVVTLLALCLGLVPMQAQERKVSTAEELQAVLTQADGAIILLAPGDYGDLKIQGKKYGAAVTLRAEVPRKAVFGQIIIENSGNLVFDALVTQGQFRAEKSSNLIIKNCLAKNMLYFRNIAGLQVDNCIISDGQYGVLFNSVVDFSIRHSRIGRASEDVMRITGDSHDGLVEGNFLDDVISYPPKHPDLIQLFGSSGKTPHRITIRRNYLRDLHETGSPKRTAQGIFVSDPQPDGFSDIMIEENIINTRSPNTIYINGGKINVVVRNNTLLPSAGDGGAIIRLARKAEIGNSGTVVEKNIAKRILDETKSSIIRANYLYGRNAKIPALFSGTGARWQDFLPVLGTGPDKPGMGATGFLRELLAAQKPGAKGGPRLGPDWAE